jgi:hypothetical protein
MRYKLDMKIKDLQHQILKPHLQLETKKYMQSNIIINSIIINKHMMQEGK